MTTTKAKAPRTGRRQPANASILALNWLLPRVSTRFEWWLKPATPRALRTNVAGAAVVTALYLLCLLAFSLQPSR